MIDPLGSVRVPAFGSSVGAFAVEGGPAGGAGIAGEALGAPALACASSLQMAASVMVGCCACVLVTTRTTATATRTPAVAPILRMVCLPRSRCSRRKDCFKTDAHNHCDCRVAVLSV